MDYTGIIITGTSCSGKSSIAKALCEEYNNFEIVNALTTRDKREDDFNYSYITEEIFKKREAKDEFLTKTVYRDKYYAISKADVKAVIKKNKIPILIISPESTASEIVYNQGEKFLSFFLDATDNELVNRVKTRDNNIVDEQVVIERNNRDREFLASSLYSIINEKSLDTKKIIYLINWLWNFRNGGGIIPNQILKMLIQYCLLIESDIKINDDNISAASFDLTLGDNYFQNGQIKELKDNEPNIVIQPGDFVVAGSRERVHMPATIAGRFDLTVSMFCKGLILSNGPQVDPGFKGNLFCLLFNTSNERIELKKGQHYATIEFHKLIEPSIKPYQGKYQEKEKIMEYLPETAKYSVINQIRSDISKLKSESLWLKYLPLLVSLAALVMAILRMK